MGHRRSIHLVGVTFLYLDYPQKDMYISHMTVAQKTNNTFGFLVCFNFCIDNFIGDNKTKDGMNNDIHQHVAK